MDIRGIVLYHIDLPLKTAFQTHAGTLKSRPVILIEVEDGSGGKGYGEVTAFPTPFYTPETLGTAWHVLTEFMIPQLPWRTIEHPGEVPEALTHIQGNQMAKAGLEGALWDLYSKQKNQSLSRMIGGDRSFVEAGAVISLTDTIADDVRQLKQEGYQRYKVKVEKGKEREVIQTVQSIDPGLPIMIDANGQYNEDDIQHILTLDRFRLMMIEQPFRAGDFHLHRKLQQELATSLCMDESIMSYEDAKQAIELGSCRIINIKISRVGGLTEAIRIHDLCEHAGIPVWCGGMVETGISKAHNLALASLANFTIPGDLSSSTRYFHRDVIIPEINMADGRIQVPDRPGIGFRVDIKYVESLCNKKKVYAL